MSERLSIEPRNEAEGIVIREAGGSNNLSLCLILLMRSTGMSVFRAIAIVRAVRFAAGEGNVPDIFLGSLYRRELNEMMESCDDIPAEVY